jgi:hypothetical protein
VSPVTVTEIPLPEAADDLAGLGEGWHLWPHWSAADEWEKPPALVRRLDPDRWVAVVPFLYTWAVITGRWADARYGYVDRWCYHRVEAAVLAATIWDGTGEPDGWHRHPTSDRYRPNGDPSRETTSNEPEPPLTGSSH